MWHGSRDNFWKLRRSAYRPIVDRKILHSLTPTGAAVNAVNQMREIQHWQLNLIQNLNSVACAPGLGEPKVFAV